MRADSEVINFKVESRTGRHMNNCGHMAQHQGAPMTDAMDDTRIETDTGTHSLKPS